MIHVVSGPNTTMHSLGVQRIDTADELTDVVQKHIQVHGGRFCPLFVSLRGALRSQRWVAIGRDGNTFLIKSEVDGQPETVDKVNLLDSPIIGRYIKSSRLFYDSLDLEMPRDPRAMQRLS